MTTTIEYFGWSAIALDTPAGKLYFDPFYRPYCGAHWFDQEDFSDARFICVTHGHEEHFLDVPVLAKATGATVIAPASVTRFLHRRRDIEPQHLSVLNPGDSAKFPGFEIAAFDWKHRDINLVKALSKAVLHGNATQLSWAWSSATNAPFYAPYTGYHLTLPDGLTVLNYNEGFNSKMTDAEIAALGKKFKTDVLLAGMQLDFTDDIARGVAAIDPKVVILFPPHDKFHEMMEVTSRPWAEFEAAARKAAPNATVICVEPGDRVNATTGEKLTSRAIRAQAA